VSRARWPIVTTPPATPLAAYGRILDIVGLLGAIRAAAQSETHALQLPPEAVAKLVEGREALLEAHRIIERSLVGVDKLVAEARED
jgi:sensor histidine kinase regulating citrate/malate metabolism